MPGLPMPSAPAPLAPAANITVGPGVGAPDPLGMGLDIGSNIFKGIMEGKQKGEEETYKRGVTSQELGFKKQAGDMAAHQQAIKDMADLIETYGPDAKNMPEFQSAHQRAFSALGPTSGMPGQPALPPIGGTQGQQTLRDLGITGVPENILGLTVQQAKAMGINLNSLIQQGSKLNKSEFDAQLLQQFLEDPTKLTPAQQTYAKGLADPKEAQTAEGYVLRWLTQNPGKGVEQAPPDVQSVYKLLPHVQQSQEEQAIANVRAESSGGPPASAADHEIFNARAGAKPKTLTESELIARFQSDKAFRDSLDPESRAYLEKRVSGVGPKSDVPKLFAAWQKSEQAITAARMAYAATLADVENLGATKSSQAQINAGETRRNKAKAAMEAAISNRDIAYSIYMNAGGGGTKGQPGGGGGTPQQPSLQGQRVDKGTQGLIDEKLKSLKHQPSPGDNFEVVKGQKWVVWDGSQWTFSLTDPNKK